MSLVTSHVVGTSRAQHTTSYMSYKQMKNLSLFTTRQPIQILKKSVTSVFFLSLITSHAVSTSRAEHTTSYRGRATTSFISYHQLKTWSLLSKVLKKSVTSVFFVIDHFSRHKHQQSRAYNFLHVI